MTMTIDLAGATPRQREFITNLLAEREYALPEGFAVRTPAEASGLISRLLGAPKKAGAGRKVDEELLAALKSVPVAKYAVPTAELFAELLDARLHGDLLFVEVSEYRGRRRFTRLHGAPGSFSRSPMTRKDALLLLGHIARDAYHYTRLFGQHYACCGRCGAELTDEESRRLMLGPVCRAYFGL